MGGAESAHKSHHHHKNISSKVSKTYNEDGVIVLSDEELKHLWSHYDDNKNDLLDEYELKAMINDLIEHTVTDPKERAAIKKTIDSKGDFVHQLWLELDHDKDGKVTFSDFDKSYHKILNKYLESH